MSRGARGLLAGTIALALVGGASARATIAATTTSPGSTQFNSSTIALKSSTGKLLKLHVYVDRFSYGGYRPGYVNLQVIMSKGGESHNWEFPADDPDFVADPVSGDVVIKDSQQNLHGFAVIKLTAHPTGPATSHTCSNGDSYTVRPERLAGTFYFATGARGKSTWGHVGSKQARTVFHGRSELEYQYGNPADGCEAGIRKPPPCTAHLAWSSPQPNGFVDGGSKTSANGASKGYLELQRTVNLGRTSIARDDIIEAEVPPPRLTSSADSATVVVRTGNGRHLAGSAVLHSSGPGQTESGCNGPSSSYRFWDGSFHIGPHPLTFHLAVGGKVKAHNQQRGAEFDVSNPGATT